MRIVIAGAGIVGEHLIKNLTKHIQQSGHKLTLIDKNEEKISACSMRYDIQATLGNACSIKTLENANVKNADIFIAVTDSEEANLSSCLIAKEIFNANITIARIHSSEYYIDNREAIEDIFKIEFMINPEYYVVKYIESLIKWPKITQVVELAHDIRIIAIKITKNTAFLGKTVANLQQKLNTNIGCPMLIRDDDLIRPEEKETIQIGDLLYIILKKQHIEHVINTIFPTTYNHRRITIIGGGEIGKLLAKRLQYDYSIKLVERDKQTCEKVAIECPNILAINGDGNDIALLKQEIGATDIVCALTNNDEVNLTSCMLAKQNKAKFTISLLTNDAYANLIKSSNIQIDVTFSPQDFTLSALLSHIYPNSIRIQTLNYGTAEVIQVTFSSINKNQKFIGTPITSIPLVQGSYIAAIIHKEQLLFLLDNILIEEGDKAIIIVLDQEKFGKTEDILN
jgi:trk system potassium uptake protein TrkA